MNRTVEAGVRPVEDADRPQIERLIAGWWRAPEIVSRGEVLRPAELDGFLVERRGEIVALATLHVRGDECEVVTLNSEQPGSGFGAALMRTAEEYARERGCRRLWLTTTNDNTHALRFYQRLGLRIAAVRIGAIEEERRLKPELPLLGDGGIPIRDEIELAKDL
jgi:GNAT superfamily N-acetyltransferase